MAPWTNATYLILAGVNGLVPFGQILVLRSIVQRGTRNDRITGYLLPLVLLAVIFLATELLDMISAAITTYLNVTLAASLGRKVLTRAQGLSLAELDNPSVHDQLRRALDESRYRASQLTTQASALIRTVISTIAIVGLLVKVNAFVALLILLSPMPILIGQIISGRWTYAVEMESARHRRALDYLVELVSNKSTGRDLRLLATPGFLTGKFRSASTQLLFWQNRLLRKNVKLYIPLMLIGLALTVSAQWLAIHQAVNSHRPEDVVTVVQSVIVLSVTFAALVTAVGGIAVTFRFAQDYFRFIDRPTPGSELNLRPFPSRLQSGLVFDSASFKYPNAEEATISIPFLHLPTKGLITVTGPNGAGKSTFCKLLLGLYQPSTGLVSADERPLGEYDAVSLRTHTSAVFQDFGMFQLSIRENLRLGTDSNLQDNSDADLFEVLNLVGLRDSIDSLPRGLDTVIGGRFEEGPDFSMGQWQRLSIARALLRDLAIIVLDEPWAFQDSHANEALNAIVGNLAESILVVVVTHKDLSHLSPVMCLRVVDGNIHTYKDQAFHD